MKNKKYKLFLISPRFKYYHYGSQQEMGKLLSKDSFNFSLSLPIVASLTPDHYDIKIIDEQLENIPQNQKPDIVGITSVTPTITRAYEIAEKYKKMNIPVIMGGPHVSFLADEALKHADSVVIGEAEGAWEKCLKDFEEGNLKKTYKADTITNFKNPPIPRWDLINHKKVNTLCLQITRGCPFKCEFCIVTELFGKKHRYRNIDNVIREIKSLPVKRLFFVDDNLTINKKYAKELMLVLIPLNISWVCQSSIEIAYDDELLDLMAKAGCISILIGFESVNPASIDETKKYQNKKINYSDAIDRIHKKGLEVIGSFVVGFDADTLKDFDYIYKFGLDNKLLFTMLSILTPTPGTELYKRMKKEKRLVNINPEYVNGIIPCMKFKNMSMVEIFNKYYETIKQTFSISTIKEKAVNLFKTGYFKTPGSKDVGFIEKFSGSIKVLKRYYFTKDKEKKELFKILFNLGVKKIAAWDKIAYALLSMAGFEDYIKNSEEFIPKIRKELQNLEKESNKIKN